MCIRDSYNTAYEMAEEAHHTSNRVSVSIGNLRETQKLEVLALSLIHIFVVHHLG